MISRDLISQIELVSKALKKGSLAVIPTDTVYGIAADPAKPSAVKRLYIAKGRDKSKQIPLLAYSLAEVEKYGAVLNDAERRLAAKFWPGPLTMVLKVSRPGSAGQKGKRAGKSKPMFEGFRVPACEVTLRLLSMTGGVLRVTSANISGDQPAVTAQEAVAALGDYAEIVLDAGRTEGNVASSVVKVGEDGKITILREGAVSREEMESVLGDVVSNEEGVNRSIVFVCTGNICRSPMAEYLLKEKLGAKSGWQVSSAGIAASSGMPASRMAATVLAKKNIDASGHRSRYLDKDIVNEASLIIVMTAGQRDYVMDQFPAAAGKVYTIKSFGGKNKNMDIDDPVGLSENIYAGVCAVIERALPGLIAFMKALKE